MSKPVPFEQILRPLYEARAVVAWLIAMLWCLAWGLVLDFGGATIFLLVAMCGALALWRFKDGHKLATMKMSLIGKPVSFITTGQLLRTLPSLGSNLWLGWGYRWEPRHTRRAHEVMKRDQADIYPAQWMLRLLGEKRNPANERGMQWIHGLEQHEKDVLAPFEALKGHCAVIATTGSIKTRLVSLIAFQLVARGDTVIVIDPKGDPELRKICKACADAVGEPERFLMMHPAFASLSTRMDLLKNWDRVSQVASRVSLVLSAQEDSTFKEFCWNAVHSITNGMKYVGRRVSIATLKTSMQSRVSVERLAEEALTKFFRDKAPSLYDRIQEEINKQGFEKRPTRGKVAFVVETGSAELTAMIQVFNKDLGEDHADARRRGVVEKPEEIRGLIAILEANKEWFGKMIVSITPMLTKLSTDDLRGLLSPDYEDLSDNRPIMDMMRVVKGRHILYVGTDTLADPSVGHALAAMLLADLSAVGAEIYNHGTDGDPGEEPRRIHVIVDEWGDVMCEPLIQQANKGRGAGMFIWALGQTLSDLVDAFGGNKAKALRFMGNMNNMIVGATQDSATMEMVSEKFGMTAIDVRSQSQSTGSKTEDTGLEFSVNRGESIAERVTELFPPSLLPGMPDLQYIAMLNRSEFLKGRIPVLKL
ncbi:MAG: conjugative transfer system coupling protein TraD [Burkholderiaceae bacterium]|nr:conjugative transfer system coupling protein TraD [Burkholderiaceae bacterium]MDP3139477.1 conjugative transfer system coupling protein TraD [Burkholderiaceae bacterium]